MKYAIRYIFFLIIFLTSCDSLNGWQEVVYDKKLSGEPFSTAYATNFQGERTLNKCSIYTENDTLYINFPAKSATYSGRLTIKVHEDSFDTQFDSLKASFETVKKQLTLHKSEYSLGDTLIGECDFLFRNEGLPEEIYFRGKIAGIVRNKDFNPFDKNNFMALDLSAALYELGEPVYRDTFNAKNLLGLSVELRNYSLNENVVLEELTWDVSGIEGLNDKEKDQLTIWYIEKEGVWKPIHYNNWNSNSQF